MKVWDGVVSSLKRNKDVSQTYLSFLRDDTHFEPLTVITMLHYPELLKRLRLQPDFTGASQLMLMLKNPPASTGDIRDMGSIPGLGRCPRRGHGNPLQYSCLENPMDRGVWQAIVHGVARVGHILATKPPP